MFLFLNKTYHMAERIGEIWPVVQWNPNNIKEWPDNSQKFSLKEAQARFWHIKGFKIWQEDQKLWYITFARLETMLAEKNMIKWGINIIPPVRKDFDQASSWLRDAKRRDRYDITKI